MLAFTNTEEADAERNGRGKARSGVGVRPMNEADLERILELRTVVRWAADPRAFDLLRGVRDARWAVAEAPDGGLVGMVGAVPLGEIGVICHLAVREDHRNLGLGRRLSVWAVAYLRSRGARTVRLYATRQAEKLYGALGFRVRAPRTVYRLEEASVGTRRGANGYLIGALLLGDLPELYGVDRWAYGADRSSLIFAILRLHPGRGLVVRDTSGVMKGYAIQSSTGRANRIGPFVAADEDVARLLLSNALAAGPTEVVVPGPAWSPAHGVLAEFGFVGREDRLRMEFGDGSRDDSGDGLTHYGATPYLAT
jgi:ribosomal protein S18 acetylase RimI-like enzyme